VRLLPTLAAALAAAAVAAAPAAADSIVYAKNGNLFLTTPDGAKGYQLTTGGGYSEPSQAADGTIGALHYKQLVRLDRAGHVLSAINGIGSDGTPAIGGPYEPRISPDGTRFAYYFYVQSSYDDVEHNIRWINTGSYGTWTWADHFTSPATESEYHLSFTQPEWVTNDRLLGTMGMYLNMWTWQLGQGHGYTYPSAQWWFGLQDPPDEWGVAAYHWYDDPSLSRDGSKLAMTDYNGLYVAATHGPAWSGRAPYPEPDYVNPQSDLAAPTISCSRPGQGVRNPTWSADGSTLAFAAPDGVHVMKADCSGDRLLVPGGSDPAFGLADVDAPAQAPSSAPAATPPSKPAVTVSRLTLRPKAFRSHTTVRFTLSAAARVKLSVRRTKVSFAVDGRRGANSVAFRRKLRPGSYTLQVSAGTTATARFRVKP
jgi:hypothetical protein